MSKRARIVDLMAIASRLTGVHPDDITGHSRVRRFVHIRQAIVAVARMQRPEHSYPEIGRRMKRDHSTLVHAFEQVQAYADPARDMLIAQLACEAETVAIFAPRPAPAPLIRMAEQAPKPPRPAPPMTQADKDEQAGNAFFNQIDEGSARFLAALRAA